MDGLDGFDPNDMALSEMAAAAFGRASAPDYTKWRTAEGQVMPIRTMGDDHLARTVAMLRRQAADVESGIRSCAERIIENPSELADEIETMAVQGVSLGNKLKWIEALLAEQRRREENTAKPTNLKYEWLMGRAANELPYDPYEKDGEA